MIRYTCTWLTSRCGIFSLRKSQSYDDCFCLLSRSIKCNIQYKCKVYTGQTFFLQPTRDFHSWFSHFFVWNSMFKFNWNIFLSAAVHQWNYPPLKLNCHSEWRKCYQLQSYTKPHLLKKVLPISCHWQNKSIWSLLLISPTEKNILTPLRYLF